MVAHVRAKLNTLKPDANETEKKDFAKKWKINPNIPCAWLNSPDFELFLMLPKDELHQFLLGLFGDHIVPSILHLLMSTLTRPDLQKFGRNGAKVPFFSAAQLAGVAKRITHRLEHCRSDQTMLQISPKFTASFHELYVNKKPGVTLTGDRMRILQLTLLFFLRDIITPEVTDKLNDVCLNGLDAKYSCDCAVKMCNHHDVIACHHDVIAVS
jgi:hypothetical protein